VGAATELRFSIQNLQTDQHLKDLYSRVAIIDGQSVLKLSNMSVPNGATLKVNNNDILPSMTLIDG
jgi:hypothetical protein